MEFDVVVIGGGLAGLSSAIRLSELGKRCAVISAGQSALYFSSGSLDLLGHLPDGTPVTAPFEALPALVRQAPQHPYSKIGAAQVAVLAQEAQALLERSDIPMFGDSTKNHQRITPLGTRRSTWLSPLDVPVTDMDGLLPWRKVIVVGIEGFLDFQPQMVASSLAAEQGIAAEVAYLHLPVLDQLRNNPSEFRSANIARVLDLPENSAELAEDLIRLAADAECIILPACIGLDDRQKLETLRARIGRPVYQLPTLPPSVLGMRLYNALRQRLSRLGGIYMPGDRVLKADFDGRRITGIYTRNHTDMALQARQVVLASGSFFSNGLVAARDRIYEPVFGLDVWSPEDRNDWSQTDFFDPQPYLQFGVKTDNDMRALMNDRPLDNLYAIGAVLGGYNPLQQGCGAGVSLISALHVAHRIVAALEAKS
jgi:glycerol-3-phosphate dehydrogenase subunit B